MRTEWTKGLLNFIDRSPAACFAAANVAARLDEGGFRRLYETEPWRLKPGGSYYVMRNAASVIAFRYPHKDYRAFSIVAPHSDSPNFKIKEAPEIRVHNRYTKLNTEVYGGTNLMLWMDRPLSAAGRLMCKTAKGFMSLLVDLEQDLFIIPSLAIHMNHQVNSGMKMNPQKDTLPLFGMEDASFHAILAEHAGIAAEDILSYEMHLYNRQKGALIGAKKAFIGSPRLDDLQCVYTAAEALIAAKPTDNVQICAIFDNEEIGSMTKQGADSSFLSDVLERIGDCSEKNREAQQIAFSGSFMVSADNAHAVHPNAEEKSDLTNRCYLNKGIVIKNATRYTTDAVSEAAFKVLCNRVNVPYQSYYNRSDQPGGSTLGNILNTHVSIRTVDIGLPQLAMHSPYETAGAEDTSHMVKALQTFYETLIVCSKDHAFELITASETVKTDWQDISSNSLQFDAIR